MDWLVSNWYLIIAGLALIGCIGLGIKKFISMPTAQQLESLKEWLLFAVVSAEKKFGSGTGQIKLRYVYDKFVTKFPWLSKVISFSTFSTFVDEALDKMKDILADNKKLKDYIEKN
jgi:hypothetical protein